MKFKKALWFSFLGLVITISTGLSIYIADQPPGTYGIDLAIAWGDKAGEEDITMLFTGDIMLGRYIKILREKNGGDYPFTYMPEVIDSVKTALDTDEIDIIAGNLEGPITNSTYVNPGTAMIFNFDPETADLLAKAGFTTLNMANNHTFDQGKNSLQMTHDYLSAAGIDAFGHPDTASGPYSFTSYQFGTKIVGFLGLNDAIYKLDKDAAVAKIQELDPLVDFLIISIHWGFEYETSARESATTLAHRMVDAGADMIWGHHPHVIQNSELYQGVPIYYSLGNFVFDQYFSSAVQEGLVVGLRINGDKITTVEVLVDLVNQGEPKPRSTEG